MFWDKNFLSEKDSLNEEIWNDSPIAQRKINKLNSSNKKSIRYGAQQAMLEGEEIILPWVPDIVGKDYKSNDSLVIVGSAYAGFIEGYSSRLRTMSIKKYKEAKNPYMFLNYFLEDVIIEDHSYYSPINTLASTFCDLKRTVLFDLCRASFVCRDDNMSSDRKDKSGDRVVKDAKDIYEKYVESEKAAEWTWQRITSCGAKCIVALGSIAEHGLLRLFNRNSLSIKDFRHSDKLKLKNYEDGEWVAYYADRSKNLGYWINNCNWWIIEGTVNGHYRKWNLLPVYHPAYYSKYDPNYEKTKNVIKKIKELN